MANKNSSTIKTAFILSIISESCGDVILLLLFYEGIISYGSILSVINILIYSALLAAPLVLGIVALSMVNKVKPITKSDRVFKMLTRIFSIISIVAGGILLFYYCIVLLFVYLIGLSF